MYKLLLTFRYLRRKLIPLFALAAVALCVAMLITVISIMGGFVDHMTNAGSKLMGDVRISAGAEGFPHYQALIDDLEKMPEVEAAAAQIKTWGLLKTPSERTIVVEVVGADPEKITKVTNYGETIYWTRDRIAKQRAQYQAKRERYEQLDKRFDELAEQRKGAGPQREQELYGQMLAINAELNELQGGMVGLSQVFSTYEGIDPESLAMSLAVTDGFEQPANPRPGFGMAVGIEVNRANIRNHDGTYSIYRPWIGQRLPLTVLPLTSAGNISESGPELRDFVVVNELHSGLFDSDSKRVYVPFDVLQEMLQMQRAELVDEDDPTVVTGASPARTSSIMVRAESGITPEQLRDAVSARYAEFRAAHPELLPEPYMQIVTWKQLLSDLIRTVQNEKNLMLFLFTGISLVSVILIFVIFYMTVKEKTRDIGTLRALGASQSGIASIFLMYAGVIGVIGAAIGALIALLIVRNINEIHTWLGDGFGACLVLVGTPLALGLVYAIVAGTHLVLRAMFDWSAKRTFINTTLIGLPAGLLLLFMVNLGVWLMSGDWEVVVSLNRLHIEFTHMTAPQSHIMVFVKSAGIAAVALAVLFAVIESQMLIIDMRLGCRSKTKAAAMFALGAIVGAIGLSVWFLSIPDLAAQLNDAISITIWDRRVYFFDRIPTDMKAREVWIICFFAIFASLCGALIPALRASFTDPVETLRYE